MVGLILGGAAMFLALSRYQITGLPLPILTDRLTGRTYHLHSTGYGNPLGWELIQMPVDLSNGGDPVSGESFGAGDTRAEIIHPATNGFVPPRPDEIETNTVVNPQK